MPAHSRMPSRSRTVDTPEGPLSHNISSSGLLIILLSSSQGVSSLKSHIATDDRRNQGLTRIYYSQAPTNIHPHYANYSDGELRAITATEGPDERYLDAAPTLAQSSAGHKSINTPALNEAVADVADSIMAPPNDFYNLTEDTYTIQLDWVIDIIGAPDFDYTDASLVRKVLRHDSQYRHLDHVLRGRIFQWLCGRPLMVVMQFPADWYRCYIPIGSRGTSLALHDHGVCTDILPRFLILYLVGKRISKTAWRRDAHDTDIYTMDNPGIYIREGLLNVVCYEQDVSLTLTKAELVGTNLE